METKKLSDLFIAIDANPAAAEAMLKIAKSQITVPQIELDGMKVVDRIVLPTDKPIRKNKKGETTNFTRSGGTGTRDESLVGSFEQGIDLTKFPPRLTKIGEDKYELFGGFGRSEIFKELDYKFWIYDVYEVDTKNRNKFLFSTMILFFQLNLYLVFGYLLVEFTSNFHLHLWVYTYLI